MKKLLGILMAALLVVPLVSVMAIEGNYYTYTPGQEVNFYMYEGDSTGSRTIVLEDEGANSQYVRVLVTGFTYASTAPWIDELDKSTGVDPTDFKQVQGYKGLQDEINDPAKLKGAPYARNASTETSLLTLDDLINVFGATAATDKTYTIDWAKWGSVFAAIPTSALGLYTQTVEGDMIWVLEFERNEAKEVTSAVVKQVSVEADNGGNTTYAYMPVLYADKTYDCIERDGVNKFACYDCEGDYQWTEIGKQADTCELVENVKVQSSCVVNIKTGIDQYFIQFGLIAGVCALALVAVNRKNLFRKI